MKGRPRLYATKAERQAAYRRRMKTLRARAMRLWVLPVSQAPRLTREIPWLSALIRERDALRARRDDLEALAEVGRRWEAEKHRIQAEQDDLANKVAALESKNHEREQRARRQRARRQQDPEAETRRRAALPFGDRLAPSTPTTPTIDPNLGQIDPTDRTRSGQNYPTIDPRIGQDRDTISPRIGQDSPRIATPAPHGPHVTPTGPVASTTPAASTKYEEPWWVSAGIRTASPVPRSAPPPSDGSEKLLEKIKAAGYGSAIRGDKVLYGGTDLLTPEEWVRRMPGILE